MLPDRLNYSPISEYPASAAIDRAVSHIGEPGGLVGDRSVAVRAARPSGRLSHEPVSGLTDEEADALVGALREDPTVEKIEVDDEIVYERKPSNVIEIDSVRRITVKSKFAGNKHLIVEDIGVRTTSTLLSGDEAARLAELLTS